VGCVNKQNDNRHCGKCFNAVSAVLPIKLTSVRARQELLGRQVLVRAAKLEMDHV
jgi:hypothetical protein